MHDEKLGTILKCYLDFEHKYYFELVLPENSCTPVLQYRKLLGSNKDWSIKCVKDENGLSKTILKNKFTFNAKDVNNNSILKYFQTQNELVIDDNVETYIELTSDVINRVYSYTSEFARTLSDKEFITMFLYKDQFRDIVVNSFDNPKDAIEFESKLRSEQIFDTDLYIKINFLTLFLSCVKLTV
jgi:hypothetical protein